MGSSDGKILCPFCRAPYTKAMLDAYNGTYGCDSGCEYVTIVVKCESCDRNCYVKGDFGYFDNDKEKSELLADITLEEIEEAIKKSKEA